MAISQKQKQRRGNTFEEEFRYSCNLIPVEVERRPSGYDYKLVFPNNTAAAIELKVVYTPEISISRLTAAQISSFLKAAKDGHRCFVIVNWRQNRINCAYAVPLELLQRCKTMDPRGSLKLPRIKRFGRQCWDLTKLMEVMGVETGNRLENPGIRTAEQTV